MQLPEAGNMIRGETIDEVYKIMRGKFTEEAQKVNLNWEEARCVVMRMMDDITDNLMEAFYQWKSMNQPDTPVKYDHPYG